MKNRLETALNDLKKQTGLSAAVFAAGGGVLASTCAKGAIPPPDESALRRKGIYSDAKAAYFSFLSDGRRCIGAVQKGGADGEAFAFLLKKLFDGAGARNGEDPRDVFLKLLLGKYTKEELMQMKAAQPRRAEEKYFLLNLTAEKKHGEAITEFLKTLWRPTDIICPISETDTVFLKSASDSGEYRSAADFAHMLSDSIAEELGISPVISAGGTCEGFSEFSIAYQNAMTALRLGKILDPESKVYYYKDYLLVKLFEELSRDEMRKYLDLSLENINRDIFGDKEIMLTAEQFIQNNLNVSETARLMYLHRNTLIYRLDKLEKETGLNIRRFSDAMTFRALRIIMKLM